MINVYTQALCKFELGPTLVDKCSVESAGFCHRLDNFFYIGVEYI